jgi:hypothetical protein
MGGKKKSRARKKVAAKKLHGKGRAPDFQPRERKDERTPWNKLDVTLELHFCESLRARYGFPRVIYESAETRRENST